MILIVDDSDDLRELFCWILQSDGYEVASAATGGEALAILAKTPQTRLVLLDFQLPDMTGLEVARALAADPALPDPRVVFLSGAPVSESGGRTVLLKPVDPSDLLAAVRALVAQP